MKLLSIRGISSERQRIYFIEAIKLSENNDHHKKDLIKYR